MEITNWIHVLQITRTFYQQEIYVLTPLALKLQLDQHLLWDLYSKRKWAEVNS